MRSEAPVPPRAVPPDPDSLDDEPGDRGSPMMRFGGAISAALLASIVATTPAAVRIAPSLASSSGGLNVWVALLAAAFLPLLLVTVLVRHAVAALRLFDAAAVATGIATTVVWAITTFLALFAIGAFLRATTHHHGLAGVTFGIAAVVAAGVLAPVAVRVVQVFVKAAPAVRWSVLGGFGILVGVGLAFFGRVLGRSDAAAALTIDLSAFAFAAAFGAGAFPHRSRPIPPLAILGPPLAAVLLFVGFGTLSRSVPLRLAMDENVPVLSAALRIVGPSGRSPAQEPLTPPPSSATPAPSH